MSGGLPPIVCAVDDRYATPLCVFMQSLSAAHGGQPLRLVVLHQDLGEEGQRRIRSHATRLGLRAELRAAPPVDPRYPVTMWGSSTSYLRLSLPDLFPDERLVLYLDVDALVLRDLRPLLSRRLDGKPLAAVRDPLNPTLGSGLGMPGWQSLGLTADREYCNTGVLLVNLPECRRRGVFEEARRFAGEMSQHLLFWDQDPLNWALADDWVRLERCWNTFCLSPLIELYKDWKYCADDILPFRQLIEDEKTAAVLHFAGPVKPWAAGYPDSPERDLYLSYLRMVTEHEREEEPWLPTLRR